MFLLAARAARACRRSAASWSRTRARASPPGRAAGMPTLGVCRVPGTEATLAAGGPRRRRGHAPRRSSACCCESIAPWIPRGLIRYGGEFWPEPIVRGERLVRRDGVRAPGARLHRRPDLRHDRPQPSARGGGDPARAATTSSTSTRGCSRRPCWSSPSALLATLPALAGAGDVPLHRRRGDRGRRPDGEALHRRVRGRLADAQLARADRRRRGADDGRRPARLRPDDARRLRAARAVRLPLPDQALRRRLRLHVPGGGLRRCSTRRRSARRPRSWPSRCCRRAA